ncbi:hypothetical protein K1719_043110 [Acacia pycnantha]|nr:hypothetical protein K1719_043110 [Acacia pycnantha]
MEYNSTPWPFYKWGMDLLGPFKAAPEQLRWLIVAVDYFTKWIEDKPLTTITSARVRRFVRQNIFSHFGIPAEVVTDNGTQFTDRNFQGMMVDLGVTHHFASVEHPQSNGQAEVANKVILDRLRKKIEDADSSWVEQLYNVLWGYRTTIQSATQEMPFRMTMILVEIGQPSWRRLYRCEAMIPVEIGQPSWRRLRTLEEGEGINSKALATELDLVDEVRITTHCRDMVAKQIVAAKYNRKVRPRSFDRGDLVLRRAYVGNKNARDGKLAANWDGPYRVKEKLDRGAYVLETLARKPIKRTWNADKLRVYYR